MQVELLVQAHPEMQVELAVQAHLEMQVELAVQAEVELQGQAGAGCSLCGMNAISSICQRPTGCEMVRSISAYLAG